MKLHRKFALFPLFVHCLCKFSIKLSLIESMNNTCNHLFVKCYYLFVFCIVERLFDSSGELSASKNSYASKTAGSKQMDSCFTVGQI